uniref:Uncharacterized protein n=1 Tax=Salix viminalis TaxID=40686 RepID=A0A6N2LJU3_SALVM
MMLACDTRLKAAKATSGKSTQVPKQLFEENESSWTRCLCGFFPGARLPFHAVRSIATSGSRSAASSFRPGALGFLEGEDRCPPTMDTSILSLHKIRYLSLQFDTPERSSPSLSGIDRGLV